MKCIQKAKEVIVLVAVVVAENRSLYIIFNTSARWQNPRFFPL